VCSFIILSDFLEPHPSFQKNRKIKRTHIF